MRESTAPPTADYPALWSGFAGGDQAPHAWQARLGAAADCPDRLIRIPTGFGKTFGVLGAWVWNRLIRNDDAWPRRLVWCLPMRVLVEQTESEVRAALGRIGMLRAEGDDSAGRVGVHLLMGGSNTGDWHLYPERCAVLIGTQDMLLSRALNRGYGAPRARWPMDFGLLAQDCLWVMDEVQLMDVGLATSGQLQAFRHQDARTGRSLRPCRTWWMSATLQPAWLSATPEMSELGPALEAGHTRIPPAQRTGPLWDDVEKPCQVAPVDSPATLADRVADAHLAHGRGAGGPTLVVLNTVPAAVQVYTALTRTAALAGTDLRLVHSRFRGAERGGWRSEFLNRAACALGNL